MVTFLSIDIVYMPFGSVCFEASALELIMSRNGSVYTKRGSVVVATRDYYIAETHKGTSPFIQPHPHSAIRASGYYSTWLRSHNPYNLTSMYGAPLPYNQPTNGSTLNKYFSALFNKADSEYFDKAGSIRVNLLDLFRTRMESAKMIVQRVFTLLNAFNLFKKGNIKKALRQLGVKKRRPKPSKDNLSPDELWLEYNYGWKPLLSDIYTLANSMFTVPPYYLSRNVELEFAPAKGKREYWGSEYTYVTTTSTFVTAKARATGYITVDEPAMYSLAQMGITNPAAVIWESVPFSFVADWFLPIGDYINQMGAINGLNFSGYNITAKIEVLLTQTCKEGISYQVFREKRRIVKDRPSWHMESVLNSDPMGIQRASYALSLISVIFRGNSKS